MDENMKKFIDFFEHGEYDNDNHFQLERGWVVYGAKASRPIYVAIKRFSSGFDYQF
ncbi:TPA: hypothetical protein LWH09_002384 [Listeria innocua]|nr:hypothetical protein [Listeria innocua]